VLAGCFSYDELDQTSSIAIASLGATRTLVFRSVDRLHQVKYSLEHGSILIMNRETQRGWLHAVPPEPQAERRISLTFRRFRAS
jgi:alkylated DNA repair dioxygenase AlkB